MLLLICRISSKRGFHLVMKIRFNIFSCGWNSQSQAWIFIIRKMRPRVFKLSVNITCLELLLNLFLEPPQFFLNVPVNVSESSLWMIKVELSSLLISKWGNHLWIVSLSLTKRVSLKTSRSLTMRTSLTIRVIIAISTSSSCIFHLLSTDLVDCVVRLIYDANGVEAFDILGPKIANTGITLFVLMLKQNLLHFGMLFTWVRSLRLARLLHIQKSWLKHRARLRRFSLMAVLYDFS